MIQKIAQQNARIHFNEKSAGRDVIKFGEYSYQDMGN